MDMREMVDKVKKGEPLYGHSSLSPYMQGVAARNSRYAGLFIHVVPWANFVNHNQVRERMGRGGIFNFTEYWTLANAIRWQHGVDTAKYYQQAERELAEEDAQKA